PETARSPGCVRVTHLAVLLAAGSSPPGSRPQRSPAPGAEPPTHLRGHPLSSLPDPGAPHSARPSPLPACLADTTLAASSSFLLLPSYFTLSFPYLQMSGQEWPSLTRIRFQYILCANVCTK